MTITTMKRHTVSPRRPRGAQAARRRRFQPADPNDCPVAVVISCHRPYLQWWPDAVRSAAAQTIRAAQIIAVFDDCTLPQWQPSQLDGVPISYHRVTARNPCVTRNRGAEVAGTIPFLLFLDADDRLAPDFLERSLPWLGDPQVGYVYPRIEYIGERTGTLPCPPYDYWALRRKNYCASASVVRREAYVLAGRWNQYMPANQDWDLWLRMTARGWIGAPAIDATLYYRIHTSDGEHVTQRMAAHRRTGRRMAALSTITILAPLCGRKWAWPRYRRWLTAQTYASARTELWIHDNTTEDTGLSTKVRRWLSTQHRYHRFRYWRDDTRGQPGTSNEFLAGGDADRRRRWSDAVAWQCARWLGVMSRHIATDYVLVVEDDVVPPIAAAAKLIAGMRPDVAVTTAVVPSRWAAEAAVAVLRESGRLRLDQAAKIAQSGEPWIDIARCGFGCTLIRTEALRQIAFRHSELPNGTGCSHDWAMCRDLLNLGWKIRLQTALRCKHYTDANTWL